MGWMLIRLVLSLLFVAAVLLFAARLAKKRGLGRGGALVEVLARQPVTRASSVNVIKVVDRVFLVGATETNVTLLAEIDATTVAEALPEDPSPVAGQAPGIPVGVSSGPLAGSVFDRHQWSAFVQGLRDKTVRRP